MRKTLFVGMSILLAVLPILTARGEPLSRDSVLLWAAGRNLMEVAGAALSRGSSLEDRDLLGNTPLHAAVPHSRMVAFLLSRGADPQVGNAFGQTPLHHAVRYRDSVELLLAAGANPRAADAFGRTPVDLCVDRGSGPYNLSILQLLLSK